MDTTMSKRCLWATPFFRWGLPIISLRRKTFYGCPSADDIKFNTAFDDILTAEVDRDFNSRLLNG